MLVKEYRFAMPLTVEEYRIGQLYMIARHSLEQSEKGEGVETVTNEPFFHEVHGQVMQIRDAQLRLFTRAFCHFCFHPFFSFFFNFYS